MTTLGWTAQLVLRIGNAGRKYLMRKTITGDCSVAYY